MANKKIGLAQVRANLKRAFQILIIIGGLAIFSLFGSIADSYLVLVPIIPMLIYIIYGYQQANKYKHMGDFSDSVYYMGFIFTLASLLSVVLTTKVSNEPTKLLNYFGMALSSTILGIIFRSFHHQFTNLNQDPIQEAKKELQEEVNKFTVSVDEMRGRIENFSEALISTLPDKLNESVNKFDEKFNSASDILSQNMDELVSSTDEISRKTKQSFSNLHDSIDLSTQNISTMSSTIEQASNENIKNLSDSTKKVSRVIDSSLDNYSDKLSNSIEQMSDATSNALSEIEKVQQHIASYSNQLASNSGSNLLKTTLDSLEQSNDDFIALSDKIKDTATAWNRTNDSFENTSKTLRQEINKIQEMFKEMGSLIENKVR
jgi:methyl-accepting chemotaxis protein